MVIAIQIVTALVALYAAGFSTWLFFRQKRLDRPNVWVGPAFHYPITGRRMADHPAALVLKATNSGRHETVLTELALEIPGFVAITPLFLTAKTEDRTSRHNRYEIDNARLAPGDTITVSFDYAQLLTMLSDHSIDTPLQVRGLCHDSLYNFYASRWFEIGREAANTDMNQTQSEDAADGYVVIENTMR